MKTIVIRNTELHQIDSIRVRNNDKIRIAIHLKCEYILNNVAVENLYIIPIPIKHEL